jgi:two-component system OmpR family sensor kinase
VTRPPGLRRLRWRLAALIGLVVVLAVAGTFVVIYRGTGVQLRDQIDSELRADAEAFDRGGVPVQPRSVQRIEREANDYLQNQPYRASSRLLFLRVGQRRAVSNEPDLLSDKDDPSAARALLASPLGYSNLTLPDAGELRIYRRTVVRGGVLVGTIAAGEPLAPVERAQTQVARTFLLAGSATLVLSLLLGYLVAARTTRPLRRMARVAAQVDGGDLSPRMRQPGRSDEIRQLADSFDTMLDRLEDAFARQRAFASDASHELRTPLTVIRGQVEVLARMPEPTAEDVRRVERLVRTEMVRMERLVEDLLVLARADESEFLRKRAIDLEEFCQEMLDGLRTTADRRFELDKVPAGNINADPDRLAQALRNLIRNSIDHTGPGGLVRLTASADGDRVTIAVEDDGPGIPPEQRERVFDRFHRTDSARNRARGGAGLGLAIVRAVAEAHGGRVAAGESPEGGARVQIELPGFSPERRRPLEGEPPGAGPSLGSRVGAG